MKQLDVTKKAFKSASALVENMDFEQLFGDDHLQLSDDQMDRAQREVVSFLRKRAAAKETP